MPPIQPSLRDSCNAEFESPTLKRWAIVGMSLRDNGRPEAFPKHPYSYYFVLHCFTFFSILPACATRDAVRGCVPQPELRKGKRTGPGIPGP